MPLIQCENLSKSFGPVTALQDVCFSAEPGEVHALVGENGAGKSTLMKILAGAEKPDRGRIVLDGRPVVLRGPAHARSLGIAMIYQELNLAPHLTVEENITLGLEQSCAGFVRSRAARVREILAGLGHPEIDPQTVVGKLSVSLQQVVEIARALIAEARVVIMDEPTSSLGQVDVEALFRVIRRLRERGIAVIYISHFLEEVGRIAQQYTVLRDGRSVAGGGVKDTPVERIIHAMVGRPLTDMFPRVEHAVGPEILRVNELCGKPLPRRVSFSLRAGEILGIAGLVGSGRSETLRCLFGLQRACGGEVILQGGKRLPAAGMTPRRAMDNGLDLLSENRRDEGLATSMSVCANITLSCLARFRRLGMLNLGHEAMACARQCRDLSVRCHDHGQAAGSLSGGNQQKVALGRMLEQGGRIMLLDEPTRGIDIGSKAEICRLIGKLAAGGKALIIVSSYLPELLGVCDTIAVMHRGILSSAKPVSEWSEHKIMLYAATGNYMMNDE